MKSAVRLLILAALAAGIFLTLAVGLVVWHFAFSIGC